MDIYSSVTRPSFRENGESELAKSRDVSSSQPGSDFKTNGRVQLRASYEINSLENNIKKIDQILNLNSNLNNLPGPNIPPSSSSSALTTPSTYFSPSCIFKDTYLGDESIPYLVQQLILKPRINLVLRGNNLTSTSAAYLSENLLKRFDKILSRSGTRYFFDQNFMKLYQEAYPKVQNRYGKIEEKEEEEIGEEEKVRRANESNDIIFNGKSHFFYIICFSINSLISSLFRPFLPWASVSLS